MTDYTIERALILEHGEIIPKTQGYHYRVFSEHSKSISPEIVSVEGSGESTAHAMAYRIGRTNGDEISALDGGIGKLVKYMPVAEYHQKLPFAQMAKWYGDLGRALTMAKTIEANKKEAEFWDAVAGVGKSLEDQIVDAYCEGAERWIEKEFKARIDPKMQGRSEPKVWRVGSWAKLPDSRLFIVRSIRRSEFVEDEVLRFFGWDDQPFEAMAYLCENVTPELGDV